MSYYAYVTTLKNLRKHSNADRLQVGECLGNSVVVSLEYTEGQRGIYFPVDGKLSEEFAVANNLVRKKDAEGKNIGGYLDPNKRNITAIKLRNEKSDGLFLPLKCLETFGDISTLNDGDRIDTFNGHLICEKYIPRRNHSSNSSLESKKYKAKQEVYPYFIEHIDTPQLRFSMENFKPGDIICLTEKVHGTSSRNAYSYVISYKKNIFDKIFHKKGKKVTSMDYLIGTRRTVVENEKGGYYGSNGFRIKWGEKFQGKLEAGEEVFGEIAGYTDDMIPIMPSVDNIKTNDKNFIKKFGNITNFTYGCDESNKSRYFIYRMTYTSPSGYIIEYPWDLVKLRAEQMGFETVPELDRFIYTTEEDFISKIKKCLDIPSTIDSSHIIEGVVVRVLNSPYFKVAKEKSWNFKVIEGIAKNEAENPDMEEAEELLL